MASVRDRLVKLLRGRRQPVSTRDADVLEQAVKVAKPPHRRTERRHTST